MLMEKRDNSHVTLGHERTGDADALHLPAEDNGFHRGRSVS
jgi:hypothetical protein